jgi:hypothetical protein
MAAKVPADKGCGWSLAVAALKRSSEQIMVKVDKDSRLAAAKGG